MNNIYPPLYRAKESYTGKYIEGYLTPYCPTQRNDYDDWYIITNSGRIVQIDPTTLAIHHQGMIDSERNKIFASLSEDGLGGDILSTYQEDCIALMDDGCMKVCSLDTFSPNGWNFVMDRLEEFYSIDIKAHTCTKIGIKGENNEE